jgi:hypothetical protein
MTAIVILVLGGLGFVAVGIRVMAGLERRSRREFERRPEEWKPAGHEGPSPVKISEAQVAAVRRRLTSANEKHQRISRWCS